METAVCIITTVRSNHNLILFTHTAKKTSSVVFILSKREARTLLALIDYSAIINARVPSLTSLGVFNDSRGGLCKEFAEIGNGSGRPKMVYPRNMVE